MTTIVMFRGPLDGLEIPDEVTFDDEIKFGYSPVGRDNYSLSQEPSEIGNKGWYEMYDRTLSKSIEKYVIFMHNEKKSNAPRKEEK